MFIENMFKVLNMSKFGKFIYDFFWFLNIIFDGKGFIYFYILDYLLSQNCFLEEEFCFKLFYLGLWEVFNVNFMNKDYLICGLMMDVCDFDGNVIVWLEILMRNFYYYYDMNRVFFGMYMYLLFFFCFLVIDYMKVVKQFFKYVLDLGDVWILILFQIIVWMKDF